MKKHIQINITRSFSIPIKFVHITLFQRTSLPHSFFPRERNTWRRKTNGGGTSIIIDPSSRMVDHRAHPPSLIRPFIVSSPDQRSRSRFQDISLPPGSSPHPIVAPCLVSADSALHSGSRRRRWREEEDASAHAHAHSESLRGWKSNRKLEWMDGCWKGV